MHTTLPRGAFCCALTFFRHNKSIMFERLKQFSHVKWKIRRLYGANTMASSTSLDVGKNQDVLGNITISNYLKYFNNVVKLSFKIIEGFELSSK